VIAGVDEAGRGSLAGPLSVGIVIYDREIIMSSPEVLLENIDDSKKLTPAKRIRSMGIIMENSVFMKAEMVSHAIVDRLNVNAATEFALGKLLLRLPVKPDVIIMDGNFNFSVGIPVISVIGGDSKSITIASASIAAKVTRDGIMDKFGTIYPDYGFGKHKGYGTAAHREAIIKFGPCPIHRKTYEPVKSMIKK
jgi:ribonuclease HII